MSGNKLVHVASSTKTLAKCMSSNVTARLGKFLQLTRVILLGPDDLIHACGCLEKG